MLPLCPPSQGAPVSAKTGEEGCAPADRRAKRRKAIPSMKAGTAHTQHNTPDLRLTAAVVGEEREGGRENDDEGAKQGEQRLQ